MWDIKLTEKITIVRQKIKGPPVPKWMLDGIPGERKGVDFGFDLDTTGRTPGPELLKTGK